MPRFQLIAIDLDGTLLRSDHSLSPANRAAVRACVAAGAQVVLATGRSFPSLRPYAQQLELDGPMIALNGATIGDMATGTIRARTRLSDAQLAHVAPVLIRRSIAFCVFGPDTIYGLEGYLDPEALVRYGEPPAQLVPTLNSAHMQDPIKILSFLGPGPLDAELQDELEPLVAQVRTGPLFLEWLPQGISKGDAIQELMRASGIPREAVLAIGDGQNDIEMFAAAGLGVAMANAPAEVQRHAAMIARTCDEDGVAEVLRRLVL